jgi:hypothetical protein
LRSESIGSILFQPIHQRMVFARLLNERMYIVLFYLNADIFVLDKSIYVLYTLQRTVQVILRN